MRYTKCTCKHWQVTRMIDNDIRSRGNDRTDVAYYYVPITGIYDVEHHYGYMSTSSRANAAALTAAIQSGSSDVERQNGMTSTTAHRSTKLDDQRHCSALEWHSWLDFTPTGIAINTSHNSNQLVASRRKSPKCVDAAKSLDFLMQFVACHLACRATKFDLTDACHFWNPMRISGGGHACQRYYAHAEEIPAIQKWLSTTLSNVPFFDFISPHVRLSKQIAMT